MPQAKSWWTGFIPNAFGTNPRNHPAWRLETIDEKVPGAYVRSAYFSTAVGFRNTSV